MLYSLSPIRYQFAQVLGLDGCQTGSTAYRLPPGLDQINTPLDWRQWEAHLTEHPDGAYRNYIVTGNGFRIGFDFSQAPYLRNSRNNMQTAYERPDVIRNYLGKECGEGRVMGATGSGIISLRAHKSLRGYS